MLARALGPVCKGGVAGERWAGSEPNAKARMRGHGRPVRAVCVSAGTSISPGLERSSVLWRGEHKIAYERRKGGELADKRPTVCIVHGFGSNYYHFAALSEKISAAGYNVICPDLIGFGDSDKPASVTYNPYTWSELVADFVNEHVDGPVVLVGNSIGSQVALMAAAKLDKEKVKGVCLLNCAGGMNQKGLYQDDLLLRFLSPVFGLLELILQSSLAPKFFDNFRSEANVRDVLEKQVYINRERVTDELVKSLMRPSDDPGALSVFRQVYIGDPGPRPERVVPEISAPIAVCWGLQDRWTPPYGTVASFFRRSAQEQPDRFTFQDIDSCGHCPFDDRPDAVAAFLTGWLPKVGVAEVGVHAAA